MEKKFLIGINEMNKKFSVQQNDCLITFFIKFYKWNKRRNRQFLKNLTELA